MTEPASAAPAERAGGLSYKGVYVAFFGLLLAAGVVAGVMYFKLLHYRRVAALHLPPDTTVAARIDVEDVVLFEPVRKHLLTLANTLRPGDPGLKPRLKRLEQHTRIEFVVDLREIAVARGPTPGDWVVIFGGLFPKEKVVRGLREVFVEEGIDAQLSPSGETLTLPGGLAIGQSEDNCILIAASVPRLESALPQQNSYQRLGLAPEGPAGFAFSGEFLRTSPGLFSVTPQQSEEIERVHGRLRLGKPGEITTQVELRSKATGAQADQLVAALKLDLQAITVRAFGTWVRAWSREVRAHSPAPGVVQLDAQWERPDLDRAAEGLARNLKAWAEGPRGPG